MIGYHLSCGLEAHFAMEIENDVLNLMRQREIEDPSEASMYVHRMSDHTSSMVLFFRCLFHAVEPLVALEDHQG